MVLEQLFFILGILNNVFLIGIFFLRKIQQLPILKRFGWFYLFLLFPAVWGIFLSVQGKDTIQFTIFLIIFVVYLLVEGLFDFVLKVDFRRKWQLLVPYLFLYYASNYGFVVMVWKGSLSKGVVMLVLAMAQITLNLLSHQSKAAK